MNNRLSIIGDGLVRWNGKTVADAVLIQYLRQAATLSPALAIVLDASTGVSCGVVERYRRQIAAIYDCCASTCREVGPQPRKRRYSSS